MKTNLSREHRRILETTCAQARSAAEAGAERALHALAVGAKEAPGHQNDAQKKLRVRQGKNQHQGFGIAGQQQFLAALITMAGVFAQHHQRIRRHRFARRPFQDGAKAQP